MAASPEILMNISECAVRLGTSVRHIRRLVAERRIPYVKVGKFIRFDSADIATWIDGNRQAEGGWSGRAS